jgi:hypothetical protein
VMNVSEVLNLRFRFMQLDKTICWYCFVPNIKCCSFGADGVGAVLFFEDPMHLYTIKHRLHMSCCCD